MSKALPKPVSKNSELCLICPACINVYALISICIVYKKFDEFVQDESFAKVIVDKRIKNFG